MKAYIYDDTFLGLLTAIYHSFYARETPHNISTMDKYTPDLLVEEVQVLTDEYLAKKVENSIKDKISRKCLRNVYLLYLSNYEDKGLLIYNYLKLGFKIGEDVDDMLHLDLIRDVNLVTRRVTLEAHRFKGFVRFSYINERFLYASINPDNNILELISLHFQNRFPSEYWIIHDKNRNLASVYNKEGYEITEMTQAEYEKLKNYNDEYTDLWKAYFKAVTIEERKNLRLQSRMMPKRYWSELPEL